MGECWKPIPLFDKYEVSDRGNVRRKFNYRGKPGYKAVNPIETQDGYLRVGLSQNHIHGKRAIHRLVLELFVCQRPAGKQGNHKDGNKRNNSAWNLEWMTPKENIGHAWKIGLFKTGAGAPAAKLRDGEIWLIRKLLASRKVTQRNIAKMFKITQQHVSAIKIGTVHRDSFL